ncbi:MAG: 26S protease regulatory subunit [Selenomonadaceae bacterium]|nr:26S protease regulatory subunit [Selenomonadaceae bacterium]MBR6888653.1 26S protease regulatory subunit [Selenomonadaceae bacterium]
MGIGKRVTENLDEPAKKKAEESIYLPEEPKFSLADIVLPAPLKEKILDVAEYAQNSHIVFETWGLEETHKYSKRIGINLYGASGTGKTMAAHAIAKHLGRKILAVNYADIESKYVGETPKNIRKVFEVAKASNSILFFDEADAILSRRVTNMSNATDVSVNQTRSVMLMLMNEFQDFIIFATNFIENFDPAFMRRISMHVEFTLPDLDCRKKLWQMYIPKKLPTNVDFDELAEKFDGISGSDISNAVLNAAFKAARRKMRFVDKSLFFEAVEDILNSRKANEVGSVTVTKRKVSAEYVQSQLNKTKEKEPI